MDFDVPSFSIALTRPTMELPEPDLCLTWHEIRNRDLWLTGEVDFENVMWIIRLIQFWNKSDEDKTTPITIHISSVGGSLEAMFALYSTIRNSEIPVHTVNEGMAASAAFIIFLAGEKRTMLPYSHFIAHEGSACLGGTSRETKAAMAQYDIDVDTMASIIAERTKITKEKVKETYDAVSDWYIRHDEALELGIITEE